MPLKLLNQALGTITMVPEEGTSQNFTVTIPATNGTMAVLPTGLITLWYGNTANVPGSWVLCDGQNGTPDLRDKFVVGAGGTYAAKATGGSADAVVVNHTHTASSAINDPGHNHVYDRMNVNQTQSQSAGSGSGWVGVAQATTGNQTTGITATTTVTAAGVSGTNANLPPYMALCYIMKL